MNRRKQAIIVLLLASLVTITLVACGGDSSDGETLLKERCRECHSLDRITTSSKSAEGWETNVDRMILRGASLDDLEREALIQYLTETYP